METSVYPFTNSMLLRCLNQMLAVMEFSQHRVSSSQVRQTTYSCECPMRGACQDNMRFVLQRYT